MAEVLTGIAAVLDAEGIQSANVFGHSLGAGVAHAFARRYPQRVDKLVLSGFGLYTRGHTRLVTAFVRLFSRLPESALAAFYRPRIARLLDGADEDERVFLSAYTEDLFAAHTKESALARFAVLLDLAAHPDRYAAASAFERPEDVLLIAASDDRGFTAREREALLATYPGARAHVFGRGGHWAAVTHPTEYDAYLLYADPRIGHRGSHSQSSVLFIGPHRPYLAYVADVLPSLGEEGVQTCTLRDLVPEGAAATFEADPKAALLKSSADMDL